jgi:hypothetical protein
MRSVRAQPQAAVASTEAQDNEAGDNIPGKSIPQRYSYRLFVKSIRKVTCRTVSLGNATPTLSSPNNFGNGIPQRQTTRQTLDPVYP